LLALTESVLRWGIGMGDPPLVRLDPATEYELIGPANYTRWGNRIEINEHGMRGPEIANVRSPAERRVLLIGDSVIYGGHFIDQTDTIAAHTRQYLREQPRLSECEEVTVLPLAASSWGPVNQAAFLARIGGFDAQTAGLVVSAHDLYDTPQAAAEMLPYRTSAPLLALTDAAQAVIERLRPPDLPEPKLSHEQSVAATLEALTQMVTQLRAAAVSPTLIYHPTISERSGPPRPERMAFQDWALAHKVPFLDLGVLSIGQDDYRDNIHPNAIGTSILAEQLAKTLGSGLSGCGG